MRKVLFVFLIVSISFFFSLPFANAGQINAEGKGKSLEAATANALQKITETAILQLIDADTFKKNKSRMLNAIKGKNYIIGHEQVGDEEFTGSGYIINVVAQVNMKALENDINTLGLLQEAMGNPRIMVLYNPNLPMGGKLRDNSERDFGIGAFFDNSYGSIVEVLADKGFDVIDKRAAQNFSVQLADTHQIDIDLNKASAYGLKYHADLILYYQTIGIVSIGGKTQLFLRAELINPTTARIISSKKVEHTAKADSLAESAYRSADEVGKKIAVVMINSIKSSWTREKISGSTFILVIDNMEDMDDIASFKEQLKKYPEFEKIREIESGGGKTTYEIKYTGGRDQLDILVLKASKQLGWKVKRIRAEGNRSTWKKI